MDGVLNLYKPVKHSSAQYVYRLRRILDIRKVGHAGTLDPFADGVLIACVGKATKRVERLMGLPKRYRTTLRLGVTNATFDTEQPFEPVADARGVPREEIERRIAGLIGEVQQTPPAFSAMRVGGVFAYKLAAQGKPVTLKPRTVRIDEIKIEAYDWPRLTLEILCGRGTYIRAVARDLGAALNCGACCESLTRLAVGRFRIEESVNLLTASPEQVRSALRSLAELEGI